MARNRKITELNPITKPSLDDALAIAHVQTDETKKVTVRDLNLEIPQPRIRVESVKGFLQTGQERIVNNHDKVYAYWEDIASGFQNCNPEYWLYRYKWINWKKINRRNETPFHQKTKKQFAHPSHQNGVKYQNSAFFGGSHDTGDLGRNTEWQIANTPLVETHINLEPWNWFRGKAKSGDVFFRQNGFPTNTAPILSGARNNRKRIQAFKLRIAIDNPDTNSKYPKIFGPFSETFILYPYKEFGIFTRFKHFVGPEAAPELKREYPQPVTVLGTTTTGGVVTVSASGDIYADGAVVARTVDGAKSTDGSLVLGQSADGSYLVVGTDGRISYGVTYDRLTNTVSGGTILGTKETETMISLLADGSFRISGGDNVIRKSSSLRLL